MASDITTSETFSTQNMKPDPGEIADAIWAQKVAANTAIAYFQEIPLEDIAPTAVGEPRFLFTKQPSHKGIKAVTWGLEAKSVTEYMRVFAEGADPTDHAAFAVVGTLAYTRSAFYPQRFDLDISGLVNGSAYLLAYARDTTGSSMRPSLSLGYGSNATY